MKKLQMSILVIFLSFLLCLFLAACDQQPVPSETGGTTAGTDTPTTTESSPTISRDPVSTTVKPIVLDIDLTAPWTAADVEGASCAAFSDVGYYHFMKGKLCFMDTENGITVVLCQKAGCEHSDSDCEAHISGPQMLFYSGGHIYYNKKLREDPYTIYIFRRNADGTGEESVAVLGKDYISSDVSLYIGEHLATEGALYFIAYTMEDVKKEDGSVEVLERDAILLRLDLKTGKQKEILRKRDTLIRLFGAREDALLFYTQDHPPAESIGDPDYYDRIERMPARVQVWSESAGGCVTLFEKPNRECTWIMGLQGSKLYYTDDEKYYTYDLAAENHTELDWTEYYVLINDHYLLDQDGDAPEGAIKNYAKFLDLRTGQFVPTAYSEADMRMLNITDRGCIVEITYYGEPIPIGSGSYTIPRLRQITGYVAYAALEDGLQEGDLLVIKDETFTSE